MKRTVLTYGLISGGIAAALMFATLPFMHTFEGNTGYIVGYTGIVLSGLLIFFGVRSYRENVGNGKISFGRGLAVGILIAFISASCYVAAWELIYYKISPGIVDKLFDKEVEKVKESGAPQAQIDEKIREVQSIKEAYANPLVNIGFTFLEPFPVFVLLTLLSAVILRRR